MNAAKQGVPPHLAIGGVTRTPQRGDKDEKSERMAMWCVFLRKGKTTFIRATDRSSFATHPQRTATKRKAEKSSTGLKGEEYRDIVRNLLTSRESQPASTMNTRSTPRVHLLHDRAPAHTSAVFTKYATANRIQTELLPPASPDLSPHDSGFFGTVKTKLEAEARRRSLTWDKKCEWMEELLQQEPSNNYIEELPRRWQACINVKGWHIEREVRRLKRKSAS